MNIEDQVCAIEHSKRLEELGVKQESLFYYLNNKLCFREDRIWINSTDSIEIECQGKVIDNLKKYESYSAFTASELSGILPKRLDDLYRARLTIEFLHKRHWVYYDPPGGLPSIQITDENLANALAKILIYLLENGLIKNE